MISRNNKYKKYVDYISQHYNEENYKKEKNWTEMDNTAVYLQEDYLITY